MTLRRGESERRTRAPVANRLRPERRGRRATPTQEAADDDVRSFLAQPPDQLSQQTRGTSPTPKTGLPHGNDLGRSRFRFGLAASRSSSLTETPRSATERKPRLSVSEFRFAPIVDMGARCRYEMATSYPREKREQTLAPGGSTVKQCVAVTAKPSGSA